MTARTRRPKGVIVVAALLLFAAIMIPIYWISFFLFGGVTTEKCYLTFEHAFPAADAWMAFAAFLGCVGLLTRKPWGVLFSLLAGSASTFLGLMDVLFDLEYGIYWMASPEVATEIAINILTLVGGPAVVWYVWTRRDALL
jgi:hypothetical protein